MNIEPDRQADEDDAYAPRRPQRTAASWRKIMSVSLLAIGLLLFPTCPLVMRWGGFYHLWAIDERQTISANASAVLTFLGVTTMVLGVFLGQATTPKPKKTR